jgi:glycosyltransferase involved in cell wall biosynthesis
MSLGCPILCSDVEAQKSLLNTHKVGLLFKAGDYEDLIKIFFKLYLNKDLRNKLSANCIDAIKNHLNNDIISKNLVNYYNE